MRHLERPPLNPNCLDKYNYITDAWRPKPESGLPQAPSETDRKQIWNTLNDMQLNVCAYCEGGLEAGGHIEHFAKRSSYRELTFEWTNLFGSCNREDCCGHFKDSSHSQYKNYNLQDLIKPDVENPWEFLVFGSDGRVSVRDGISPENQRKGQTTIDVLNLKASCHIPERISRFALIRDILLLLEDDPTDEIISLIVDEIICVLPFLNTYSSAALQHLPVELVKQSRSTP
jgi:uncharacterized protein (TIGR02646 family)